MSKYEFMIKGTLETVDSDGNPFDPASGPTDDGEILNAVETVFDDTEISIYDEDNNEEVFVNVEVLESTCSAIDDSDAEEVAAAE